MFRGHTCSSASAKPDVRGKRAGAERVLDDRSQVAIFSTHFVPKCTVILLKDHRWSEALLRPVNVVETICG
jgi:hypothetical protein